MSAIVPLPTRYISTTSELVPFTLTSQSGAVILPQPSLIPGRSITFKEIQGRVFPSTIVFSTLAVGQVLEDNAIRRIMSDRFGSYTFTSGSNNTWYVTGGTTMNIGTISSMTAQTLSTVQLSTAATSVSTLKFQDFGTRSTFDLYMKSTFLFFGSSNLWAGTRAAIGLSIPIRRPFLPSQIASLAFWFDASDPNTIVLSGGRVLAWNDKSGNRRNAIGSVPPAYINNGIYFNGTFLSVTFSSGLFVNVYYTIFVVERLNSTGGYLLGDTTVNGGGAADFSLHIGYRNTVNLTFAQYADDIEVSSISGTGMLRLWVFNSPSYTNRNVRLNGTVVGSRTNVLLKAMTQLVLGGNIFGGNYFNGTEYEVLAYNNIDLSVPQIQQIEGYLAWKWGLTQNLPPSHPFKFVPPQQT